MHRRWSGSITAIVLVLVAACSGAADPTPAERQSGGVAPAPTASAPDACTTDALDGRYARQFTAENTDNSDLFGEWELEIAACTYRIAENGEEQGGGRIELADGDPESGTIALSDDLGCPNEFTGSAFYDIAFDGTALVFEEAIAGTDQCEGRAEVFVGSPPWDRTGLAS